MGRALLMAGLAGATLSLVGAGVASAQAKATRARPVAQATFKPVKVAKSKIKIAIIPGLYAAPGIAAASSPPLPTTLVQPPSPVLQPSPPPVPGAGQPGFGSDVIVFSPTEPQASIQAELDTISDQQVRNQFGSQRYAVFFEPGTYGSPSDPLIFQIGYYTEVAGLGAMPQDTVIDGEALVLNQCSDGVCNGTDNFWRSVSNLTIDVTTPPPGSPTPVGVLSPPSGDPYGTACDDSGELYAASQAMPIRRVIVRGSLTLQDYCAPTGYVSGGFIADSEVTGDVNFDGQQQYLVRNSDIGGSSNSVWNMVFSGVQGAPAPVFTGTGHQYTTLPTSPVTEEEPFLYTGPRGDYHVFVPAVLHESSGPSWAGGTEAGTSLAIGDFFVASPATPVAIVNMALARGQDLILTPGVYDIDAPIIVSRPGTVVMGLGFATLVPEDGNAALDVTTDRGVKVSDLIVDAGPANSPVLFSLGHPGPCRPGPVPGGIRSRPASTGPGSTGPNPMPTLGHANDPDLVSDVFFRVGGAETTPVSATVSFLDQADGSILDDVWAWRADHGNAVGWTVNQGATGLVVTGSDVTAYGLAVEHYQKYEVVWDGQGGTDVFYQNELPYDPPDQAAWMATATQDGYPAFLVGDGVTSFDGYGMGSYAVFIDTSASVFDSEAFEAPETPGVVFHDIFDLFIAGPPDNAASGIDSVINSTGGPATVANKDSPVDIVQYPPAVGG